MLFFADIIAKMSGNIMMIYSPRTLGFWNVETTLPSISEKVLVSSHAFAVNVPKKF